MTSETCLALEMPATADALRHVCQRVDRLARAGHAAVARGTESAVLHCNGPAVVEALEVLAQRLAQVEE